MIELSSYEEVISSLAKENLMAPSKFSNNYQNVFYECGCGQMHDVSQSNYDMCAYNIKFFFDCENKYVTFVKIKGFFKMKAVSLWTCKIDVFNEAISTLFPEEKK